MLSNLISEYFAKPCIKKNVMFGYRYQWNASASRHVQKYICHISGTCDNRSVRRLAN